ncbi:MAG: Gfo/Idh/MocA family oxidoreductase [Bryobacterales bacterium]|nr:Gfo/Idh/MocA family oxidoreductase [Bryobacterales bacterium]
MSGTAYGVAVIGAGAVVAQRHLPGLDKTGRGEAVSIFDPNREATQAVADKFQIPRVAGSAEEAIAAPGVDVVIIASPNSFHREQMGAALAARKHVLCEKPIALSLADAAAMRDAAERAGLVVQLGFHHRFSAEHAAIERLLAADVLGKIEAFHSIICEPIDVVPGGTANYRFDPVQGGGLTLVDMGSHRVDQMRALLGEVDEVHCRMGSVLETHQMDDSIVLSLRMRSGAIGTLGFHRFSRGFFSPCTLAGTDAVANFSGMVVNPYQSAPVSVFLEQAPEKILPPDVLAWTRPDRWWGESRPGWVELWPPRRDTFEGQWNALFDAIEQRGPASPSAEDGYRALEIVQAAYRSHRDGAPVRLPLDASTHVPPPVFPSRD